MGASDDFPAVFSWVRPLLSIITARNFPRSHVECDVVRTLAKYLLQRCIEYEHGSGGLPTGGDLLGSAGEGVQSSSGGEVDSGLEHAGEGLGSLSGEGGDCEWPRSDERRGGVSSGGWPRDAQWQHMGVPDAEWASSLHVWPRQTLAQPPQLFWGQPPLESQPPWQLHRQRQWQ